MTSQSRHGADGRKNARHLARGLLIGTSLAIAAPAVGQEAPVTPVAEPVVSTSLRTSIPPSVTPAAPESPFTDDLPIAADAEDLPAAPIGPVQAEPAAAGRAGRVQRQGPVPGLDTTDPRDSLRAGPVEIGVPRPVESDPFAPVGLRLGTLRLTTRLEQDVAATTNADGTPQGRPGTLMETRGRLTAVTDWSRHQLQVDLTGSWARQHGRETIEVPRAGIDTVLRLDLGNAMAATLRGAYTYTTEATTGDALLGIPAAERPGLHTSLLEGSLSRAAGRIEASLRGSLEHVRHERVALAGGGSLDQSDRDYQLALGTLRVQAGPGAVLRPFAEVALGKRDFTEDRDRFGEERDSTLYALRSGLIVDMGEKLSGEASIGYLAEHYDSGLDTLDAFALDASLDWSPMRGTTLSFDLETALAPGTGAGSNGSVQRTLSLSARQELTHRLDLTGGVGLTRTTFDTGGQVEHDVTARVGIEYWLNRFVLLTSGVEHTRSIAPGDNWHATTVRVGIALQR